MKAYDAKNHTSHLTGSFVGLLLGFDVPMKIASIRRLLYAPSDFIPVSVDNSFGDATTLSCKTMLIVGDDSPHLDDVTAMNSSLNPANTTLVKVSDCGGLVLEEQPEKVSVLIQNRPIAISRVLQAISDQPTNQQMDQRTNQPTEWLIELRARY